MPVASDPPLKLVVDATSLLLPRTGIGTFTAELLKALGPRPDVEVSAFVTGRAGHHWLPDDVSDGVREIPGRLPSRVVRTLWRHTTIPRLEWLAGQVDVVHGPNYLVPPSKQAVTVVSVHDVGFEHDPPMSIPGARVHRQTVRTAIGRGAWVHTISDYVAAEVRSIYDIDPDRVVTVPVGVWLPPPGANPVAGGPFVLALGSVDRRKDLPTLVAAFNEVAPEYEDLRLVVAGPDGDAADEWDRAVAASPYRHRIVRLGWVDEPTRSCLLHEAAVVAYPSLYEGLGMVPLEAMLAGTPVVTTRVAAIPEAAGHAALYVGPGYPEELAGALERVLADAALASDLVARGRIRASRFTWDRTAEAMVGLYRRAVAFR